MVPITPDIANSDVTHDRSSWSNAPFSSGEVSSDSSIKKLDDVYELIIQFRFHLIQHFID